MFFAALNTVVVVYALYVYFTFDRPRQAAAAAAGAVHHADVVSYKVLPTMTPPPHVALFSIPWT